ncbi:hypothetical protein QQ045_008533 [Rhodiola kirilowii]
MAATPLPTPSPSPSSSSSPQPQSQQPESESKSVLATTEAALKPILLAIPVQAQKKPQPVQWTPEETANLIEAYQEKWYSLKKGQLKAHQWEEVTVTVAARCGYDEPNKTSTQCRHKMEKLRKRYRAEKRKSSSSSAWPFFDLMDRMECGPEPISARPVNMVRFPNSVTKPHGGEEDDEDEDNDNDNNCKRPNNRSRSINNLLRKPTTVNRFPGSSRFPLSSIRKREDLTTDTDDEDEDEEFEVEVNKEKSVGGDKRLLLGLAAEMRSFAQRIAGVEKKKMEMMRETEKIRMEMESKRVKMILDSQSKMMETIDNWLSDGRGPRKKMKVTTTATQI